MTEIYEVQAWGSKEFINIHKSDLEKILKKQ
jgi:hypothetical protein